jgi:hypothetical protein
LRAMRLPTQYPYVPVLLLRSVGEFLGWRPVCIGFVVFSSSALGHGHWLEGHDFRFRCWSFLFMRLHNHYIYVY